MPKTMRPIPELPESITSLSPTKRKVVSRSPYRSVGIMACSWIQDHGIEYESQLERRFLQQALLLPRLKRIIHQPFKIDYTDSGREKHYTPDFLLEFVNHERVLVEVKPLTYVSKYKTIFNTAKSTLESADIPFFVITDKQIDIKNRVNNASIILRYGRGSIDIEKIDQLSQYAPNHPPIPIKELILRHRLTYEDIFHLMARKRLFITSLSEEINDGTLIHFHKEGTLNGTFLFCDWFSTTPW